MNGKFGDAQLSPEVELSIQSAILTGHNLSDFIFYCDGGGVMMMMEKLKPR